MWSRGCCVCFFRTWCFGWWLGVEFFPASFPESDGGLLWGNLSPVSFPETDGGLLWGNLAPVSFPETVGGLLSGNLPRGLFVAHGRPLA